MDKQYRVVINSLQGKNVFTERVPPDALEHLRESGVTTVEQMSGDVWATPRASSPVRHIANDCILYPHANRLDALYDLPSKYPGYYGIHTTIFTQQPSIDEHDSDDIYSHDPFFSTDDDVKVSSIIHFDKKGALNQDGSYGGPFRSMEHEIRHAVDFQRNRIAIRIGKKPENLNAFVFLQKDRGEHNGIESENLIAERLGLPLRTTYGDMVPYSVDQFTDSLPNRLYLQKTLLTASAELQKFNEQLLRHASGLKKDPEDPVIATIRANQHETLRGFAEDRLLTD